MEDAVDTIANTSKLIGSVNPEGWGSGSHFNSEKYNYHDSNNYRSLGVTSR